MLEQLAYQDGEYFIVEWIVDIREKDSEVQIQAQQRGFNDENPTWEIYNARKDDIPGMVEDFISDIRDTGTSSQQRVVKTR